MTREQSCDREADVENMGSIRDIFGFMTGWRGGGV